MARVLVTRPLTEGGTDPLLAAGHEIVMREDGTPLSPDELASQAAECDGIVCHLTDRIDAAVLESGRAGRLRVVANAAVGYDNIDVASAHAMGITVCNTPGVLDDTTADLAFLLILAATRQATAAERGPAGRPMDGLGLRHPPRPGRVRDRHSGSSASGASQRRWRRERSGSTWRSSTPPATTPG